jgi:predicted aldo/keto reductase-like oxidoreductase
MLEMIDKRLANLGLDYVDCFYLHGIGPGEYGEASYDWPKSPEFKETAEALKKSGKVKFVGFTCHDGQKVRYLQAAAEGGLVDMIMFAYDPLRDTGDEFKRALDACHKADIGLVAMKVLRPYDKAPARLPELDKLGLTTRQAILHACWSDERIANISSNPTNTRELEEGVEAARLYKKPLDPAPLASLKQVAQACGASICPNCDGRCARAAGVDLAFADIARYVNYYERDGRLDSRDLYQQLQVARRWAAEADLAAAQEACFCRLNFAEILRKAERYFA